MQILLFTEGTGYVATPHKAFQIEEVSVFVPRFDQESFFIQADSELSFLQIVANLSDYDRENMADSHIALPRFRPVSQGWQYEENFKTRDIESYTLIEHRYFGRLSMGAVYGKGPNEVGQHIHNELEQWYYALPGAKFTYHVTTRRSPSTRATCPILPTATTTAPAPRTASASTISGSSCARTAIPAS